VGLGRSEYADDGRCCYDLKRFYGHPNFFFNNCPKLYHGIFILFVLFSVPMDSPLHRSLLNFLLEVYDLPNQGTLFCS